MTHPSPLVEGPYETYDLPTTSILCAAAKVNFKTSPTYLETATAYGMEVSTHTQSKIMINSTGNISTDVSKNGQKSEKVTSFNHLRATLCKDGACSFEIRFNGTTKQDLTVQHHQLRKQVQVVKVSCHFHPSLRL